MKFSDGNWLVKEQYSIQSAFQLHDFYKQKGILTTYVSPRPILSRGNMLDTMLLTVQFHSPLPGIIGVKIIHHKGVRDVGPHFELFKAEHSDAIIEENENAIIMRTGELAVHIAKGFEWRVDFYRGTKRLTGSLQKSIAYIKEGKHQTYVREELDLGVGEWVYGLGERFTPFVKNGQTVEIWNQDGGTSSEQAYKNIPFYMTNKGYGVFINQPDLVSLEIASEKVKKVQFSVQGESLHYFIIDGPDAKGVLDKYTQLTGRPALPPPWTFGLWLSTSFTTNYDEATVNEFVDGMVERDIPLQVFHFDCFWMKEFHWTDFKWDERVFPDPKGMLKRLKDRGLKICVWINPYIAQQSRLFDEGVRNGYFVKKVSGDVWQWDLWQPGMALVDFTNPAACNWYASYLHELVDMGVDSFKTDFGERIPTDVVYFNGANPHKMHNYYTQLYNKCVFEVLEERLGKHNAVLFARSATAGGQQYPVHWGGDCYADFESMAESLRGGLSLGLSGFGFWSHDIGGFENTAPVSVFKRWLQFGLLSSHSRLHGSRSYRVPWEYDDEAVEVTRKFTKLKARLMPYLYRIAVEAHQKGTPAMRAMIVEFFGDPAVEMLDRQYMLGDSLLVAPIFTEEGEVIYYLPAGKWTHLLTGDTVEGGKWFTEVYDYFSLPLFVREHTILPLGKEEARTDYDYTTNLELHLYYLQQGKEAQTDIYDANGKVLLSITAKRTENQILLNTEGNAKNVSVIVHDTLAISHGESYKLLGTHAQLELNSGQQIVINLA